MMKYARSPAVEGRPAEGRIMGCRSDYVRSTSGVSQTATDLLHRPRGSVTVVQARPFRLRIDFGARRSGDVSLIEMHWAVNYGAEPLVRPT
jgi:hypothetical protein